MKLIPKKQWMDTAKVGMDDAELVKQIRAMIADPRTATEVELPVGFAERHPALQTEVSPFFTIDDSDDRKAAADLQARMDKLTADRAKEDAALKAAAVKPTPKAAETK